MGQYKIGIGYDIHALGDEGKLVLGGVEIPFNKGFTAHSDGDVLLHALCDAVLGALGEGDIGMLFPDTDPAYKDGDSKMFLSKAKKLMVEAGYITGNIDCIVVAQEPKVSPHKEKITGTIADILEISREQVNVKGKTAEKMGPVGEGKAIEAHAVVLLEKI